MKNLSKKHISGGTLLLVSVLVASIINLAFNVFVSRMVTFEEFGLITLINTFLYIALIPFTALQATINHHIAYITGKDKTKSKLNFFFSTKKNLTKIGLIALLLWIAFSPIINNIFHINELLVPLSFSPVIIFGILIALNKGFLQGEFLFKFASLIIILEAVSKFMFAWIFINVNFHHWVYLSVPLSVSVAYFLSKLLTPRQKNNNQNLTDQSFPKKFFIASLISGISSMAFFTLDILLAKHFLPPTEAGQYAFLSLIGKMVYFFGILPSYLIISFVSNDEGNNRNPKITFYKLFSATFFLTVSVFIAVAPLGKILLPFIFGNKVFAILPYLYIYSAGIALLTLSTTIMTFHLARKQYLFPVVSIVMAVLMSLGIAFFHNNIYVITQVIFIISLFSLMTITLLHVFEQKTSLIFKRKEFQLST